jgi:hypothetical protein
VAFAFLSAKVCMPLRLALHLGLTGARLSEPADLLGAGLATHYVHSSNLPQLRKDILAASYIEDAKATLEGAHCCQLLHLRLESTDMMCAENLYHHEAWHVASLAQLGDF